MSVNPQLSNIRSNLASNPTREKIAGSVGLRGMLILWSAPTTLLCGPQRMFSLELLTPAEGQRNHHKSGFLGDSVQPFVENNDCGREIFFVLIRIYITEFLPEEEFCLS